MCLLTSTIISAKKLLIKSCFYNNMLFKCREHSLLIGKRYGTLADLRQRPKIRTG